MKRTKKLTVTALLSALSVVLLVLGSLVEVLDISTAAIVSCFVIFFRVEFGGAYPYLFWAVTSFLSILLLPSGAAGPLFLCLGPYPLLKAVAERRRPVWEWAIKLLFAVIILVGYVLLAKFVFMLPDAALHGWLLPVFLVLGMIVFVLYDIALSRLIVFYSLRIRPRISHFLK